MSNTASRWRMGQSACEFAARALGLQGEVIVPAFTFIATAHALAWHGVTPVFCDVDPSTHAIDLRHAEELITPQTSGIVGVHLWGRACDVEALAELAGRRNLALFFDAAHAFGCTYGGQPIGQFGACEVFSFHATKFVHSGEGVRLRPTTTCSRNGCGYCATSDSSVMTV